MLAESRLKPAGSVVLQQEPADDDLMRRTAMGEETAFRLLVQRWEGEVRGFLTYMLGSPESAEDLAQETFVKVYRQAGRYRAEGKFRSWLLRIAGNLARSELRRRKIIGWIRFENDRHDRPTGQPAPDQELQAKELENLLAAAVDRLPRRQKEALVLVRFQGLRYQEAAEVMQTTLAGLESLLQRATRSLRDELSRKAEIS